VVDLGKPQQSGRIFASDINFVFNHANPLHSGLILQVR